MSKIKYFTEQNFIDIAEAHTFPQLFVVAQDILARMPEGQIYQICGPISTGTRSVEENLSIFDNTIQAFVDAGLPVFNQLPFGAEMGKIKRKWEEKNKTKDYCKPILTEFYLPLFQTGRITNLVFIPGWSASVGSRWEMEQSKKLHIPTHRLPPNWCKHYDVEKLSFIK